MTEVFALIYVPVATAEREDTFLTAWDEAIAQMTRLAMAQNRILVGTPVCDGEIETALGFPDIPAIVGCRLIRYHCDTEPAP